MPFNLFLLPLLGGYIFIINWNQTKYKAARYSGNRLTLTASIAGTVFLLLAISLVGIGQFYGFSLNQLWQSWIEIEYFDISIIAFLLGGLTWLPLNLVTDAEYHRIKAIKSQNDVFEILCDQAIRETKLLLFTLKSGKVYIGITTVAYNPGVDRKYIQLLPFFSGYRKEEDKTLVLTTSYLQADEAMTQERSQPNSPSGDRPVEPVEIGDDAETFEVVLPVVEIQSASRFDITRYDQLNP